jgi:hypothetical protein
MVMSLFVSPPNIQQTNPSILTLAPKKAVVIFVHLWAIWLFVCHMGLGVLRGYAIAREVSQRERER